MARDPEGVHWVTIAKLITVVVIVVVVLIGVVIAAVVVVRMVVGIYGYLLNVYVSSVVVIVLCQEGGLWLLLLVLRL